jgi:hypothetical protein
MNKNTIILLGIVSLFIILLLNISYTTTETYIDREYYTINEAYSDIEYYSESEPYNDIEYYMVKEPYDTQVINAYNSPVYTTYYSGWIEYTNGVTNFRQTFTGGWSSYDTVYTGQDFWNNNEYTLKVCNSEYCYTYYRVHSWNFNSHQEVRGYETKYRTDTITQYRDVQKSREITKYRNVQKSRTVIKYHDVPKFRDIIKTKDVTLSTVQRIFN